MSIPRRRHALVPVLALSAVVLAGCGSDDGEAGKEPAAASGGGSSAPSAPSGTPACSEVWVDGSQLPRRYSGCTEDGTLVKPDVLGCESGQRMVRYADRYYAVFGGTVHEASTSLEKDREYRAAVLRCRA